MTDIAVVSLLSNVHRSCTQCNPSSVYVEQTFVCRVAVQLIFKNFKKNKKIYTKCKSAKIPAVDLVPRKKSENVASC